MDSLIRDRSSSKQNENSDPSLGGNADDSIAALVKEIETTQVVAASPEAAVKKPAPKPKTAQKPNVAQASILELREELGLDEQINSKPGTRPNNQVKSQRYTQLRQKRSQRRFSQRAV